MFGILNNKVAVPPTAIFPSFEVLWDDLSKRMADQGYKIVKARSQKSKAHGVENEMSRCDLVCHRGGRPYTSQATKVRAWSKKTGCPWTAKASNRRVLGGWVLTIVCDQHNHPPGTPEPPERPADEQEGDNVDGDVDADPEETGPRPDPETAAALQVAGVSDTVLKLTGDTFNQFKNDYRAISQAERFGILSQLQLRIAAIYAVQNEELHRQQRAEARERQHRLVSDQKLERQRAAQYAQWQQIQHDKAQAEAIPVRQRQRSQRGLPAAQPPAEAPQAGSWQAGSGAGDKRPLRWNEPNVSTSLSPATTAERAYGRAQKRPRMEGQAARNTEALFDIPDD